MEVIRNMDTKECPKCGSNNIQTLSDWIGCFECQYQKLYGREIITVPAGRTYYYDGKYKVQTTKAHTSEDRYVTLILLESIPYLFVYPGPPWLFEGYTLAAGHLTWGEIDRCHMVRKNPIELGSGNYVEGPRADMIYVDQTSRGKNTFNEM